MTGNFKTDLTGEWQNSITCSYLCIMFLYLFSQWLIELRILEVLIPTDGSGPVKHEEEACLASKSTLSLPSIPQCPCTQTKRTLLKIAKDFNAFIASATRPLVATVYFVPG